MKRQAWVRANLFVDGMPAHARHREFARHRSPGGVKRLPGIVPQKMREYKASLLEFVRGKQARGERVTSDAPQDDSPAKSTGAAGAPK